MKIIFRGLLTLALTGVLQLFMVKHERRRSGGPHRG